jgi:hypothetical protein
MIESAESVIKILTRDLSNYDNPDPGFDNIRLMLDRTWIERQIEKYAGVKNRLQIWQNSILAHLSASEPCPVHTQGQVCLICHIDTTIIKQTA